MDVDLFDFLLPQEQVAQEPAARRDASRLMVLPRDQGGVRHHTFANLPDLLRAGDLLVLNDTRVVPARLGATRPSGGRVEILVLPEAVADEGDAASAGEAATASTVERVCILRASHRPPQGETLALDGGGEATLLLDHGAGRALLRFAGAPLATIMEEHGSVPLPPYIRRAPGDTRRETDRQRYQTVFARSAGAVAAPTAGLHFTEELLAATARAGVEIAWVTLHIGPGTFRPVRVGQAEDHTVEAEYCVLPRATAEAVAATRRRGGRVIACGTTVVRTLEGRVADDGSVQPGAGLCDLFILPGYRFRVVDGMLTNFHLPRSSLVMLVSALAGRRRILDAYQVAVAEGYRFYSYGDAMLIQPGSPAEEKA